MRDKKGQAALEFLMTYGWAILVVLVVIGALAYFGVLNPNILVPEKCTMATGISCKDYRVTATSANFNFENGLGKDIIVTQINLDGAAGTGAAGAAAACEWTGAAGQTPLAGATAQIDNGGGNQFVVPCTTNFANQGRKVKASLSVTYYFADSSSTFSHTSTGEVLANLQ